MIQDVVAPGKLFLSGEYAVLDGAPAVVLAVHRGVRCRVAPAPSVIAEAPGGDNRFVAAALAAAGAPPGRYVFVDHDPPDLPEKAGLGGSAAAVVAAVLAAGCTGRDALHLALDVHRRVQGDGSGADVAASFHGGMIRFQEGESQPLPPVLPVVAWSGRAARTGGRVARWRAWSGDRRSLWEAAVAAADLLPRDPIAATRAWNEALTRATAAAGIPYETPGLARIAALAAARGGVARPSGAGGGDCAVAFLPDPEAEADFRKACQRDGVPLVALRVAPPAGAWRALEEHP